MIKKLKIGFLTVFEVFQILKQYFIPIILFGILTLIEKFFELIALLMPIKVILINYSNNVPHFLKIIFGSNISIDELSIRLLLCSFISYIIYLFVHLFVKKISSLLTNKMTAINYRSSVKRSPPYFNQNDVLLAFSEIFFIVIGFLLIVFMIPEYLFFIVTYSVLIFIIFSTKLFVWNHIFSSVRGNTPNRKTRLKILVDLFFIFSVVFILLLIQYDASYKAEFIYIIFSVILLRRLSNSLKTFLRCCKV